MIVLLIRARRISGVANSFIQCSSVGWNWRNGIYVLVKVSAGFLIEFKKAQ